jgi:ATP-dependent RNA helicase DeaD
MTDDTNREPTPASQSGEGAAPEATAEPRVTFADLGLGPAVLQAVTDMGFTEPMDVQRATIPLVRQGRDILVQSRTGSGKTAAFAIPFADWIADPSQPHPQAIVLMPTRELALQVAAETARICATSALAVVPIYGGSPMGRQIEQLRDQAQIVCGTPGRVLDHIRRGTLKLDKIKCAVLDECDEMLSMGFQEDIEHILEETPPTRQTLLFSATVPEGIQRLARRFMRDAEMLKLSADFVGVHEIRHTYYSIPGGQREAELLRVLAFEEPERAVIFCNTRDDTGRVAEFLRRHGLNAEPISSDLSQGEREQVMQRMRAGGIRFLVATDVAARGIDIENLPCVINYTFPESPEVYIHRTGRTGRAGRSGRAISLIGPTEVGSFYYLKLLYKIRPEERSLPSEAEVRSHREGERLAQLRALLPGDAGPEWHSLARRLVSAIDAERLIGSLLRDKLGSAAKARPVPVAVAASPSSSAAGPSSSAAGPSASEASRPTSVASPSPSEASRPPSEAASGPIAPAPTPETANRPERDPRERRPRERSDREYSPRDREAAPRDRERGPRDRERCLRDRGPRDREPERERREPIRRSNGSGAGPVPVPVRAPSAAPPSEETRDFWEVWSEDMGRTQPASPAVIAPDSPAEAPAPAPATDPSSAAAPAHSEPPATGEVRLYVNLGRKDNATAELVAELLSSAGAVVPAADVELMNTHSYVNVSKPAADLLCSAMNGRLYSGRAIVCEAARPLRRR